MATLTPTGTYTGLTTSYELTNGVMRDIEELITLLDDTALPLTNGTNFHGDPFPRLPVGPPATQVKVEWEEETILAPYAELTTAALVGDAVLVVGAEHQRKFQVGDNVRTNKGEIVIVTSYNSTTGINVTRAALGTTAVAMAIGDSLQIIGTILAEGSDPGVSRVHDLVFPYNFTQIFGPWKLTMSGTDQIIDRYGISDQMGHQLSARTVEMAMQRENAFLYGVRNNNTGTKLRSMAGIDNMIVQQAGITSSATSLTIANLETELTKAYQMGHTPMDLIVNPQRLTTLNAANSSYVRVENVETGRGVKRVQFVQTEYGDIQIARTRYAMLSNAWLVTMARMQRRVMRDMRVEKLAKTGDADNVQLLCEETLQIRGASQFVRFNGLTS